MKVTKKYLKQLVKEELDVLEEAWPPHLDQTSPGLAAAHAAGKTAAGPGAMGRAMGGFDQRKSSYTDTSVMARVAADVLGDAVVILDSMSSPRRSVEMHAQHREAVGLVRKALHMLTGGGEESPGKAIMDVPLHAYDDQQ